MVKLALEKAYYSMLWRVRVIVGGVEVEVAVEARGANTPKGVLVEAGVKVLLEVLVTGEAGRQIAEEVVRRQTRAHDLCLEAHLAHVLVLVHPSGRGVGVYHQIG